MADTFVDESGAGAGVAGSNSMSGATQTNAEAGVTTDVDTGEAFKQRTFDISQSWSYNTKRLADNYASVDLKGQQEYADIAFARARAAQQMWEHEFASLQKDMAEIRARRLNQFDVGIREMWNKEEELQDDLATNITLQKLIDALEAAKKA